MSAFVYSHVTTGLLLNRFS